MLGSVFIIVWGRLWKQSTRRRGKLHPGATKEIEVLPIAHPTGSEFKGYKPYDIQDLTITVRAIH